MDRVKHGHKDENWPEFSASDGDQGREHHSIIGFINDTALFALPVRVYVCIVHERGNLRPPSSSQGIRIIQDLPQTRKGDMDPPGGIA